MWDDRGENSLGENSSHVFGQGMQPEQLFHNDDDKRSPDRMARWHDGTRILGAANEDLPSGYLT